MTAISDRTVVRANEGTPSVRQPNRARTVGLLAAAGVLVVDQITKSVVVSQLDASDEIAIVGPVRLVKRFNTGMAFSQGEGSALTGWVVTGVIALLVVWVLRALWRRPGAPDAPSVGYAAGLGSVLGGALGNKVDRVFRKGGAVVDFIDVGTWWPVFNVADAALSLACIALVVMSFRSDRPHRDPNEPDASSPTSASSTS